ncbi:cysteine-rich receptor-like protein kinase 2 [Rutidosis leptorrhynchoides]|uniref:cysteine-rich receptor-like protein kinase 2 n=1 Tax=Rutidosis leptorrhynchoides TaxID=125765 RepID=UPI003A99F277
MMSTSLVVVVVIVIVLMVVELGVAQTTNNITNSTDDTNTPLLVFCGSNDAMDLTTFSKNLNSTFSLLRSRFSNIGVFYATAQELGDSNDAVYGLAQCRNYESVTQCLAYFDVAVSAVRPCGSSIGANIYLDNCFLKYENYNQFYDDPEGTSDTPLAICSNKSTTQQITDFNRVVQQLLSDISVATPRTSNFYTASTRQVTSGNATIYAIGQCVENASQAICKNCMLTAYNNLHNCLPSNEARAIALGCFMRYSEFPFFQNNQTLNLVPFLGAGSSSKHGLILAVSSGAGVLFLILALSIWFWRRKRSSVKELEGGQSYNYNYSDSKKATNDFSDEHMIGKGGFGEVFKAIVDNEIVVAVKKLHVGSRAKEEFENEVKLISSVRHRNLLLQLGWCSDGPELLLVLEYMPQGSLDKFLWGEKKGTLNWKQRFDIILGIARGLAHLHEEYHVKIIHRDIKSSNILLDNDFQPKIANFGLARLYPEDQSHITTQFAGTMGYTAPEHATHGHLSEKVDVYSFGVVALEVISGRKSSDVNYSGAEMEYLLNQAWKLYETDTHVMLIDDALDPNEYQEEKVKTIVEIALMCTQSPASLRPTMSQVYLMLSNEPALRQRRMSRPTFVDANRRIHIGEN